MNEEDYYTAGEGTPPVMAKPDGSDSRVFVVIGGGAAGAACVETLRRNGFKGKIVFVSGGADLPYDRTMLDKTLTADASSFNLRTEEFY